MKLPILKITLRNALWAIAMCFHHFMWPHRRNIFDVCLRVLGNQVEAEDALQDVFVKIWRNADRYQMNGLSFMTWLITIARSWSIDRLRAHNTRHGTGLDEAIELPSMASGPEALTIAASDRVRIVACMSDLDPD